VKTQRSVIDQAAAVAILQGWLDQRRAATSRLREEQKSAMSRLREEQNTTAPYGEAGGG
jgi:hypothetical protein